MKKIDVDLHTHTLVSDHAYSTLRENCIVANRKGIRMIAMTDHGYGAADSGRDWHFCCMTAFPEVIENVRVLKGAEANIMSYDGTLDLYPSDQKMLDFMLVSLHDYVLPPKGREYHTQALIEALKNPYTDAIAHPVQQLYPFDEEAVVQFAAQRDKALEINPHAMENSPYVYQENLLLLRLAKKYNALIVLGSDAHFCEAIGEFDSVTPLFEETEFPEKLILNLQPDLILERVKKRRQIKASSID